MFHKSIRFIVIILMLVVVITTLLGCGVTTPAPEQPKAMEAPLPPTNTLTTELPTYTLVPPTDTLLPPINTPTTAPPTSTLVPSTDTPIPPSDTPTIQPPTSTPVPPSDTPLPPTNAPTTAPPTSTPVPPTDTPRPLTNTLIPPTNTPLFLDHDIPMVLIPAGLFTMGSDKGDDDEKPVHTVTLNAFYIDQYEVTNARYAACVKAGACSKPSEKWSYTRANYYGKSEFDDYPVIYVNWNQAKTYCAWRGARLPTEAEWEKAARGTDGRTYPWGEGINCDRANYNIGCVGDTTKVGSYPKGISPYEVYDMAGNVWEWVQSEYKA